MHPLIANPIGLQFGVQSSLRPAKTSQTASIPVLSGSDSIQFGSLEKMKKLRVSAFEADLQEPGLSTPHGSVSLLDLLSVMKEKIGTPYDGVTAQRYIEVHAAAPEDKAQVEAALERLEKIGMLARNSFQRNRQAWDLTYLGDEALKQLKPQKSTLKCQTLRVQAFEEALRETAVETPHGKISLLDLLKAATEIPGNGYSTFSTETFVKAQAVAPEEKGQLEAAFQQLAELGLLEKADYPERGSWRVQNLGVLAQKLLPQTPESPAKSML